MTEINSDIIVKIRKVLAKASNNPSMEEAQVAMLLAQKMMIENNITMSDVNVSEIHKKEVVNQTINTSNRTPWWYRQLSVIIADNFRCCVYTSRHQGITDIRFIGLKNDVESAKQVYLYAIEVLVYNYHKYLKDNINRKGNGIKNQYIFGFLDGLKDKFAEQIKHNDWGLRNGETLEDHDDWDCLDDAVKIGLLVDVGTGLNRQFKLTIRGREVANLLRDHKSHGGTFNNLWFDRV